MGGSPPFSAEADDPEMGRMNRRKACDLCFTKKIKCDMLKPVCSNCILYRAECRTSVIRRKANPPRSRSVAPISSSSDSLDMRLSRIERQLQQVIEVAKFSQLPPERRMRRDASSSGSERGKSQDSDGEGGPAYDFASSDRDAGEDDESSPEIANWMKPGKQRSGRAKNPWVADQAQAWFYMGPDIKYLRIPPMEQLLPIIEHYFTNVNSLMPLFDKSSFMRLLSDWENDVKGARNHAEWAAIQIVVALGLSIPKLGSRESLFEQASVAKLCSANARSTVTTLVSRTHDLLGVRVLLGIVMLFFNSEDPNLAGTLIGAPLRLVHRLGLFARHKNDQFSPEEAEERCRLFWVAYCLEKDITVRASMPSFQTDSDIDVPLPAHMQSDGIGSIWTLDGASHFNVFRARTELAYIQGRVFDGLYSNRSTRLSPSERQDVKFRLQGMLERWYASIPPQFQLGNIAQAVGEWELIPMTILHHGYLMTELMAHGIYNYEAEWIKRISPVGTYSMRMNDDGTYQKEATPYSFATHLPDDWAKCVEISRDTMVLFQTCPPTETIIWQCTWPHFTALIILISHMLLFPSHPEAQRDRHIIDKALDYIGKMQDLFTDSKLHDLYPAITELYERATALVDAVATSGVPSSMSRTVPAATAGVSMAETGAINEYQQYRKAAYTHMYPPQPQGTLSEEPMSAGGNSTMAPTTIDLSTFGSLEGMDGSGPFVQNIEASPFHDMEPGQYLPLGALGTAQSQPRNPYGELPNYMM